MRAGPRGALPEGETAPSRARLPMAASLALAFGVMLLVTLVAVLALAFTAGVSNTRQLLVDRANLSLDTLEQRVENFLDPVGRELVAIAGELDDADGPAAYLARRSALRGMLAVAPQILGVQFVTPDLVAYRYRSGDAALEVLSTDATPAVREAMAAPTNTPKVVWGAPLWSQDLKQTIINAHLPVMRDGRLRGVLFAAVGLATMVQFVDELSDSLDQKVFVLEGHDRVVAVPGMDAAMVGPDHPLPLLAEAGDPVLGGIWAGSSERLDTLERGLRGDARRVSEPTGSWVVLYRRIAAYGDAPWIVGTYLPANVAGAELQRLWYALALSLVCLVLAIGATLWLGRRMSRPVVRLADAARRIGTLDLGAVPELPRSRIRELDEASRAFNAMKRGLGWFETYVPRRLVGQLMTSSSPDVMASREVELTVMFTDIVGFSRLAERLDAAEAAALLNHHFELLAGCVLETDGTVDKFLGDGMMAFWGAPVAQPDHAARAIRAALRMRDRVRADPGERSMRLRIGLHTGPALVGNIGSRDRLNYTLVGDTVNVAQRLEQLGKQAAPDADIVILASATTAAHAGGLCAAQSLGTQQLRGRDEWMEVFALS